MAFTCPACLRTSHNPNDEKHSFCGNCHEYQPENIFFVLSEFQHQLAKALQGKDPLYYVMKVVTQHYLKTKVAWEGILLELLPLYNATKLRKDQWDALNFVTKRTGEMTKLVPPSE